ncbi:MAG: hypothetical protein NTX88_00675, partial [Candidatus Atribacteria bacterium]|nr:hypothetical protein [Candidatus Atribacteria bacterium]
MTSRERVILSISHKEPDRIPVDLGGTEVSSICKKAYLDLMIYLGFEIGQSEREIHDISVQLPKIDKRLMEWIGVDVMPLFPNPPSAWTRVIVDERNYWSYVDQWGATLSMPKSGHYFDFRKFPLQSSSLKSMEFMNWPDPDDPARTVGLRKRAKELFEMTNYALVGTSLFGGGIFEQPARVRGMEEYFMDCACNVQFADAMMEKITEIYLKATDNYLNEVGEFIQVFCYWDDIAAQDGPFISPSFYRKYIKP